MTIYITVILSVLTLIIGILSNQWDYSYTTCDNLSPNYKDFGIDYAEGKSVIELISYLDTEYNQFRLQKQTNKGYSSVYLKNYDMHLNIIKGRTFREDDFEKHKDVAIIEERCFKNTYTEGHKRYIVIEKKVYEVIGVFSQKENPINVNSDIFVNMLSQQFLNTNDGINGRYYLDCRQDLTSNIQTKFKINRNETIYTMGLTKHFELVKDTILISWNAVLGGFLFFLLSWIFLFVIWLIDEKTIILVNYICGATKRNLFFFILKKWIFVNLLGVLVSNMLGYIILTCKMYCLLFWALYIMFSFLSVVVLSLFIKRRVKEMK